MISSLLTNFSLATQRGCSSSRETRKTKKKESPFYALFPLRARGNTHGEREKNTRTKEEEEERDSNLFPSLSIRFLFIVSSVEEASSFFSRGEQPILLSVAALSLSLSLSEFVYIFFLVEPRR